MNRSNKPRTMTIHSFMHYMEVMTRGSSKGEFPDFSCPEGRLYFILVVLFVWPFKAGATYLFLMILYKTFF